MRSASLARMTCRALPRWVTWWATSTMTTRGSRAIPEKYQKGFGLRPDDALFLLRPSAHTSQIGRNNWGHFRLSPHWSPDCVGTTWFLRTKSRKRTAQKFSSSITSCTYILLVKARDRPSGEGTMEEIHPAPTGISYKTLGLPFASIERSAIEEADDASANRPFPSADHLTDDRYSHFQSRTARTVTFRSARFRIRISPLC